MSESETHSRDMHRTRTRSSSCIETNNFNTWFIRMREVAGSLFHAARRRYKWLQSRCCGMKKTPDPLIASQRSWFALIGGCGLRFMLGSRSHDLDVRSAL